MVFPADALGLTVEIALGADRTADPTTWVWTDVTDYVHPNMNITGVGQSDEQTSTTASKLTLSVDNTDGRFTRLNPVGAWYGLIEKGTPIRVDVTDGVIDPSRRFFGYIAELPPRWSQGYAKQWVPVTASGVLRRLEQQPITDSALRRFVLADANLRAYWPLEDGAGSGHHAASAVSGQAPLIVATDQTAGDATAASWATNSDLPGSQPLPGFNSAARLNGTVYGSAPVSWSIMFWAKAELKSGATDGTWVSAYFTSQGSTPVIYRITGSKTGVTCTATNSLTDSTIFTLNTADELGTLDLIGGWHSIALVASAGVSSNIGLFLDGRSGDSSSIGLSAGRIARLTMPNFHDPDDIQGIALGHIALFNDGDFGRPADFHAAGLGYAGETADRRIQRLCAEENIPCETRTGTVVGGIPVSSRMGPQSPTGFAAALRECASADGGLLYEDPQSGGIGYAARSWLYETSAIGSTPVMALDIGTEDAPLDLTPDFEPDDGDQFTVNDMTVSRTGGSSARVQRIPAGQLADPRSVSISVASDGALEHQASWRVHLGETDEYRFPVIELDLAARPERIAAWALAGVGSRITIANPPPGNPPGDLDLIIVGYTEHLDGFAWTVRLNCAPASPYRVAELPGALTVVSEGFEDASLNFSVTNGGNAAWSRSTLDAHTGTWSFKSGAITASQTSDATVTVPAGCTRVKFWYRTSSEAGLDVFRVIVGGVTQLEASGQSPWTESPYIAVTPASTITFRYLKDGSLNRFNDRVFIDDVQFEGGAEGDSPDERARLDTSGSTLVSSVTDTTTTFTVATTTGPVWVSDLSGLRTLGTTGSYASTPDTAALDVVGDLDVRIDLTPAVWPPAADASVIAKFQDTGDQRSWRINLTTAGTAQFTWSANGSTTSSATSPVLPMRLFHRLAIRATIDVDNGAAGRTVTFEIAPDLDGAWTAFGAPITTAGVTSIFSGSAALTLGARNNGSSGPFNGTIHAAQVRSGIGGTIIAHPRPNGQAIGTTSWTDTATRLWTVQGTGSIASISTIDLAVGGEVVRAEAISGVTSPQTFRVLRSINGVEKSHPAGAPISLAQPMILALGD